MSRSRDLHSYGGALDTLGAFAEDTVQIGDHLTLCLGLRFDHSDASSPDVLERDANGNEIGTIEGRGHLHRWDVLSPRTGFNWRLTEYG